MLLGTNTTSTYLNIKQSGLQLSQPEQIDWLRTAVEGRGPYPYFSLALPPELLKVFPVFSIAAYVIKRLLLNDIYQSQGINIWVKLELHFDYWCNFTFY